MVEIPEFNLLFKQAQHVTQYFHKANQSMAILWRHQKNVLRKTYALSLAGETRWETQIYLIRSFCRSKQPLKLWASDDQLEAGTNSDKKKQLKAVVSIVQHINRIFWSGLEELEEIFSIIHNQQILSEANKANFGQVVLQWLKIETHLQSLQQQIGFGGISKINAIFSPRQTPNGNSRKSI